MSINVTDSDHGLLVRRRLGPSQRARLVGQRAGWLLESIGLALAALTVLLALASLWAPGVIASELAGLLGVTGFVWSWRLRQAPWRWFEAGRDLRAGEVALAEGPITTSLVWSWGIVRVARYRLRIDELTFTVDQETFAHIQPHTSYRVFYATRSGCFLGALPCDPALIAPAVSAHRSHGFSVLDTAASSPQPAPRPESAELPDTSLLTQRERAILKLIAAGHSNQAIADELFLSVNTVKMYCSGIYQKLGVRRRTEAVAVARQRQLLDS